ncbi:MAG: hypothetical protein ABR604_03615 [Jatrophihabitantaceae bacterium]
MSVAPGELYAMADRIARHADAVRSNAAALAAAVANDRWRGVAAELFSAEARSVLTDMRAGARRLDDAADALRRHAGRVQGLIDLVKRAWDELESRGEDLVHDFADLCVNDGGWLEDAVAHVLAQVPG